MWNDLDPMAAMHRVNQTFREQVLDTAPLSCGMAFFSATFGSIANHMREVALPAGMTMNDAYDEVQSFFARLGHPCRGWAPALGAPIEKMQEFLTARGFEIVCEQVMVLRSWPELQTPSHVRVLPARPMRQALHRLMLDDAGRADLAHRPLAAEMVFARLDDPRYEMVVAMAGDRAVGHAAMLQVGPVAGIFDVYVEQAHRRQGVASAMMTHLLQLCRRLALRTVVLEVEPDNAAAVALYERCGFARVGQSVQFRLPPESTPCQA